MKRILIVDDDPDFRRTLVEILAQAECSVVDTPSGTAAVELCQRGEKFEIAVVDMVMPGMDGLETMRELKRCNSELKVILVTAFSTIEGAVNGIKLGACDYLAKPFNINEFLALVNRTFEELRFERAVESLNLDHVLGSLSNRIRRTVIEILDTNGKMRLNELQQQLGITDHAKLLFHLKNMVDIDLVRKTNDRAYLLTPKGEHVLRCLREFSRRLGDPRGEIREAGE